MHCPTCGAAYPPGTRFCPDDGTALAGTSALDALAALTDGPAAPTLPTPLAPRIVAPHQASRAALAAIGALVVAVVALGTVLVFRQAPAPAAVASAAPVVSAEPVTPEPMQAAPTPIASESVQPAAEPIADLRVVSTPSDGFLSIRSQPDGRGTRIDRMLDGEAVAVLDCGPARVVEGDAGHWCRVRRQGGQTGWAYDAYLFPAD